MPLDKNCQHCHGEPDNALTCNYCVPDLQTALSLIKDLQMRVCYLERKTGYKNPANFLEDSSSIVSPPDLKRITFNEVMEAVDDRSLQRVFREISDSTLSGVLFSLKTKEQVDKIRNNVSKNHFRRLVDNVRDGWNWYNQASCIHDFMRVINQLEEMGEIVLSRGAEILYGFYDEKSFTKEEFDQIQKDREKRWEEYRIEQEQKRIEKEKEVVEWFKHVGIEEV